MTMVNAGTYRFGRLEVSINGYPNVIRSAPNAPVFEAIPPQPPQVDLLNNSTPDYQFVPNTSATMSMNMSYAQTADVWAVIRNVNNNQVKIVKSSAEQRTQITDPMNPANTNYYRFDFTVPVNDQGTVYAGGNYQGFQDGEWYIDEVWLQKVFDKDINFYPSTITDSSQTPDRDDCMVFTVNNGKANSEERVYSYVIQYIMPDLTGSYMDKNGAVAGSITANTRSVAFGKNGYTTDGTTTGAFMDSYSTSALTWKLHDWNNKPIDGMTVTYELDFGGESLANGGYTGATSFDGVPTTLTPAADGITYTVPAQTYQEAGVYIMRLKYNVGDYSNAIAMNFGVYSVKPVLAIDHISPVGSHKTVNSSNATTTVTSKVEGNVITIYPNSEVTGSGCNKSGKLNEEPKVWLKLTGIGNAEQAALNFTESSGGEVRLYYGSSSKEGTRTSAWTWDQSSGEVVMRFVGYNDAGSCDDSKPAGNLTSANVVVMTFGGKNYEVPVNVITIHNNKP